MAEKIKMQDLFLNQARKEGVPVTLHFINGFQLKGLVKSFDQFTVIMDEGGKQQMVYKHAIATVIPDNNLDLTIPPEELQEMTAGKNAPAKNAPAANKAAPEKKVVRKVVR